MINIIYLIWEIQFFIAILKFYKKDPIWAITNINYFELRFK